jgi:hypothetical protein
MACGPAGDVSLGRAPSFQTTHVSSSTCRCSFPASPPPRSVIRQILFSKAAHPLTLAWRDRVTYQAALQRARSLAVR